MVSCSKARHYLGPVKTATVQQVPEQWPDILKWVAAGEEVQMTDHDKVVAKLVPDTASQPDFLNRAKAVWGENPPGKSLSQMVAESRGGEGGSIWTPAVWSIFIIRSRKARKSQLMSREGQSVIAHSMSWNSPTRCA